MYNNAMKWAFERHPVLNKLTKIQIEKIVQNSNTVNYVKDQVIFEKGKPCQKLVVVLEGKLA
jgi:cGMP-dependent protein kinase 1